MNWQGEALCAQTDPDAWFPGRGASSRAQLAVCARCTVRQQCLDWALEHDERFGIWGGTTEYQRRKARKLAPTGS